MSSISLIWLRTLKCLWRKHILTGVDIASRYKVTRALRAKKASKVAFVLEAIYQKAGEFKYPKLF